MGSSDAAMTNGAEPRPRVMRVGRPSEQGFTLAAVLVLLTIIAVTIAYTVPQQWSKIMERDRDRQTIFAMKQVARAIYEFRRKNNAFPTSLEQLEKARSPRYLRGVDGFPVDPATGKNDWLVIPAGQQQPGATVGAGGQSAGPSIGFVNTGTQPANQQGTGETSTAPAGTTIPGVPAKDYVGPIGGIRPSRTGKSFLSLNGRDVYEEWTYTVTDLEQELQQRQAALTLIR